jgi:hypothetical protein
MPAPASIQRLQERYKALPKQQQLAVLFGVPVLLTAVFGYLAYEAMGKNGPDDELPTILHRSDIADSQWSQINQMKDQITAQEAIIAEGPAVDRKLREIEEQTGEIEAILPRDEEKSEIRQMFGLLAKEVPSEFGNVKVVSVQITPNSGQPGGAKSDYNTVRYLLDTTGELNGIISFIDAIEKPSARNPRFMSVAKITWKGGDVKEDSSKGSGKATFEAHSVQIEVLTYTYTPKGKK